MINNENNFDSTIPDPKQVLQFQIERNIKYLFKQFLTLLEDLSNEHDENFRKLKNSLPNQSALLNQANYLSDAKQEYLRKKVLGAGNDCIRSIKTDIDLFDVKFSDKKE